MLVSRATTGVWRGSAHPRAPARRRRPWLVAGGLAGAVIVGGLLWPTAAGGPATADAAAGVLGRTESESLRRRPPERPSRGRPRSDLPGADSDGTARVSGPTTIWRRSPPPLLTARTACARDADCLAGDRRERATLSFRRGRSTCRPPSVRSTLLDDFGGAAVLRVERVAGDARLSWSCSCAPTDDWLLRDVHDVAEQ